MRIFTILFACLIGLGSARAGEQQATGALTTIPVYVTPYYAAAHAGRRPQVAVGQAFDALLAEGGPDSLDKIADAIRARPDLVTPMTMMVLAIRYYDAGRRDDSVFWFYVAKDRYRSAARVIDFSDPRLADVQAAIRAFVELAGPYINGYAFCDIDKQKRLRAGAADWAVAHPYAAVFSTELPALPGDRSENLEKANARLLRDARDEAEALRNPETRKMIADGRRQNDADAKYCTR